MAGAWNDVELLGLPGRLEEPSPRVEGDYVVLVPVQNQHRHRDPSDLGESVVPGADDAPRAGKERAKGGNGQNA